MKKRIVVATTVVLALSGAVIGGLTFYHRTHPIAPVVLQVTVAPTATPLPPFINTTPPSVSESPPSAFSALVDLRAKRISEQFELNPGVWLEYSTMLPEELKVEVATVKREYEQARERTEAMQKQRGELLERGDQKGAVEMLNGEVIPLLRERQKMAARLMLIAYAKGDVAVDGTRLHAPEATQ